MKGVLKMEIEQDSGCLGTAFIAMGMNAVMYSTPPTTTLVACQNRLYQSKKEFGGIVHTSHFL